MELDSQMGTKTSNLKEIEKRIHLLTNAELTLLSQQKEVEQNLNNPHSKAQKGTNPFDAASLFTLNKKMDQTFLVLKEFESKLIHIQEHIYQK